MSSETYDELLKYTIPDNVKSRIPEYFYYALEVRRNRPELVVTLDKPNCFWVKWGKKIVYVVVGE